MFGVFFNGLKLAPELSKETTEGARFTDKEHEMKLVTRQFHGIKLLASRFSAQIDGSQRWNFFARLRARVDWFYSHIMQKPLEPAVLADAISDVLGVAGQYGNETLGTRAVELRDGAIQSDALDILGRCNRTNSCEGAPSPTGPLAQKLHLFNGELLNSRIGAEGGRLDKLIKSNRTPLEIVREFYQVALNRQPNKQEIQFLSQLFDDKPSAQQYQALEDFVWSIVTCQEFVMNH